MRCDRYRRQVRALARSTDAGSGRVARHVESCLTCQAELARERRLLRQMRAMRRESSVPGGLLERVLATIDESGVREPHRSTGSRVGVLAGAGALAGVIVVGLGTRVGRRALGLAS